MLLASFARIAGLEPTATQLRRAVAGLKLGGLSGDERATLAETLALERLVLSSPERFVSDGPSRLEGLALEAQVRGLWRRYTE